MQTLAERIIKPRPTGLLLFVFIGACASSLSKAGEPPSAPDPTSADSATVDNGPIRFGEPVSASIGASVRDHAWRFALPATAPVRIETHLPANGLEDSVVYLFSAGAKMPFAVDDDGGSGRASLLQLSLAAGNYVVVVAPYSPAQKGAFQLIVERPATEDAGVAIDSTVRTDARVQPDARLQRDVLTPSDVSINRDVSDAMRVADVSVRDVEVRDACVSPNCRPALRDLGVVPGARKANSLTLSGTNVLVGTEVGVFSRPLVGGGTWTRTLANADVLVVRADPRDPQFIVAGIDQGPERTIALSRDGGRTWVRRGAELLGEFGQHDQVLDVVFAGTTIYASANGGATVRSEDRGETWRYLHGFHGAIDSPGQWGYSCYLAVETETVLQGCELPLDHAWIDRISQRDFTMRTRITGPDLENRRPNLMKTSRHFPGTVWVGLEFGLLRIEGTGVTWLYRRELDSEAHRDATDLIYVRGLWVNPSNRQHWIMGGFQKTGAPGFPLFETHNDGATLERLDPGVRETPGVGWWINDMTTYGSHDQNVAIGVSVYANSMLDDPPLRARVLVREQ